MFGCKGLTLFYWLFYIFWVKTLTFAYPWPEAEPHIHSKDGGTAVKSRGKRRHQCCHHHRHHQANQSSGKNIKNQSIKKKKTNQYVLIRKNCGHTPSDKKWLGTKTSNLSEHVYKESSKD